MSKTKSYPYILYLFLVCLSCQSCLGTIASSSAADRCVGPFGHIQRIHELYEKGKLMVCMNSRKIPQKELKKRIEIEGNRLFRIPKRGKEASWKRYQSDQKKAGFLIDISNNSSAISSVCLSHHMHIDYATYLSFPVMRYADYLHRTKRIAWQNIRTMLVPSDELEESNLPAESEVQVYFPGKSIDKLQHVFFPSATYYATAPDLFEKASKAKLSAISPKEFTRLVLDEEEPLKKIWLTTHKVGFFDYKEWDEQVDPTAKQEMRSWGLGRKNGLGVMVDYTVWDKQAFPDKKEFFTQLARPDKDQSMTLPFFLFDPELEEGDLPPSQRPSLTLFTPVTFKKVVNEDILNFKELLADTNRCEYLHTQEVFAFPTEFAAYLKKLNETNTLNDDKLKEYLKGYVAQGFSLLDIEQINTYYEDNNYTIQEILDEQRRVKSTNPETCFVEKGVRHFLLYYYDIDSHTPYPLLDTTQGSTLPTPIQENWPPGTTTKPDTLKRNIALFSLPAVTMVGLYSTLKFNKKDTPPPSHTKEIDFLNLEEDYDWEEGKDWEEGDDKQE